MSKLYVTRNGEEIADNAELYILLYTPNEKIDDVQRFLDETGLYKKFDVIEAEITLVAKDDEGPRIDHESVKSLVLRMKSERVLFEYKLSEKHRTIINEIHEYLYGKESK